MANFKKIVTGNDSLDRVQQNIQTALASIPDPPKPNVVTVTSSYTVNGTEDVLHINSQSGAIKVTLPSPSASNRPLIIKQINLQTSKSKVNPVTVVTADGSQTIAGASSFALDASGTGSVTITADNTQHWPAASAGGNPSVPVPPPGPQPSPSLPGVTKVTATAPIVSSGGLTPNISVQLANLPGVGPTALGSAGSLNLIPRADQTSPAYRSDLPLSTTWFIDPVNGSDDPSNPGTTSATALKTVHQLAIRWWGAEITQNTTVNVLGNIPSSDVAGWNVSIATHVVVTWLGSLGPTTGYGGAPIDNTLYTGTVTGFVAASEFPAADDIELTDTAIPTSYTASGLLAEGVLFKRTSSTAFYWYGLKDLGSKTLRITAPMNQLGNGPQMNSSLTVGDAYAAYHLWTIPSQFFGTANQRMILDSLWMNDVTVNLHGASTGRLARTWLAGGESVLNLDTPGGNIANCMFSGGNGLNVSVANSEGTILGIVGGGARVTGGSSAILLFQGSSCCLLQGAFISQGMQISSQDYFSISIEAAIAVHDTTTAMLGANLGTIGFSFSPTAGVGMSGKGNTGKIAIIERIGRLVFGTANGFADPPFVAASTSDTLPIQIGSISYPFATLPSVLLGMQIAEPIFPSQVFETGGPTRLTFDAIPDGSHLQRSGVTIIGDTTTYLPDPGSNGIVVRTGLGTDTARTIVAGDSTINVTNGNGVAGNPTITGGYVAGSGITITGNSIAATGGAGTVTSVTASSPLASSGGTTPNITHLTSGVTAGSYTYANLTVDADGHLSAASSGATPLTGITGTAPVFITGGSNITIQGGYVSGSASTTPQNLGSLTSGILLGTVSSGINTLSTLGIGSGLSLTGGTLSATGSGGTVTSVTGTSPINVATGTTTPVISLANSGVTAGSYTYGSFTVDAHGLLSAASSGTAPVTSISVTAPITSTGGTTPTIGHATSGVSSGTYVTAGNGSFTVDADGHITAATTGSAYSQISVNGGTPVTMESLLNFSSAFTAADHSSPFRTDVGLASPTGDLSGAWPACDVAAIHETSGPTQLFIGAIADTQMLTRQGTTLVGRPAGQVEVSGTDTADYLDAKIVSQTGTIAIAAISGGSLLSVDLAAGLLRMSLPYYASNVNPILGGGLATSSTALTTGSFPANDVPYPLGIAATSVSIKINILANTITTSLGVGVITWTIFQNSSTNALIATALTNVAAGTQITATTGPPGTTAVTDGWSIQLSSTGTYVSGGITFTAVLVLGY